MWKTSTQLQWNMVDCSFKGKDPDICWLLRHILHRISTRDLNVRTFISHTQWIRRFISLAFREKFLIGLWVNWPSLTLLTSGDLQGSTARILFLLNVIWFFGKLDMNYHNTWMTPVKKRYIWSFFLFFWGGGLCHTACGILVPWPGIEPVPPALEVQSLNHWTTREVPGHSLLKNKKQKTQQQPMKIICLSKLKKMWWDINESGRVGNSKGLSLKRNSK